MQNQDVFVLRIDATGTIVWTYSFDGDFNDELYGFDRTPDGGFRIVGGILDIIQFDWSVRLNSVGTRIQTGWLGYGAAAGAAASDGGYFYSGNVSTRLDLTKINGSQTGLWTLEVEGQLAPRGVVRMTDGGAVMVAQLGPSSGERDVWVARVSAAGEMLWQRPYGQTGVAEDVAIVSATADGGVRLLVWRPGASPSFVLLQTDADGAVPSCPPWQDGELPSSAGPGYAPYNKEFWTNLAGFFEGSWNAATTGAPFLSRTDECNCSQPVYAGTLRVRRVPGAAQVYWTAGASIRYDLVRGNLGVLESTGGDFTAALEAIPGGPCLADNTAALQVDDGSPPPGAGEGLFYALRPVNASCLLGGTYDSGSMSQAAPRDPGIRAAVGACP